MKRLNTGMCLALLLALCLCLSCAFAEEAAQPIVESIPAEYEATSGEWEEADAPIEADAFTEAEIDWTDEAIAPEPGDALAPDHVHDWTVMWSEDWRYEMLSYNANEHVYSEFFGVNEVYCLICGQTFGVYALNDTVVFSGPHINYDGSCVFYNCKQKLKKNCTHPNAYSIAHNLDDYEFISKSLHLRRRIAFVPGTEPDEPVDILYCPDCFTEGLLIPDEPRMVIGDDTRFDDCLEEILSSVESHTFVNGRCTGCGYVPDPATVLPKVAPKKVALNRTGTVTLACGETLQLVPTLTPSNATATYTWTSSKAGVASVNANGLVVAGATEGTAKITVATDNKKKATVSIKVVNPNKPTKVSLSPLSISMLCGETLQLVPSLTPVTAVTTLAWSSSKPSVAQVSASGEVTAGNTEGTAKITMTTTNKKKATVTVKVTDPYKPTGVNLAYTSVTLEAGKTLQLLPQLLPASAKTTYSWKSNKPKVATVSATGLVTGLTKGTAKITVTTANKKKATVTVKVTAAKPTAKYTYRLVQNVIYDRVEIHLDAFDVNGKIVDSIVVNDCDDYTYMVKPHQGSMGAVVYDLGYDDYGNNYIYLETYFCWESVSRLYAVLEVRDGSIQFVKAAVDPGYSDGMGLFDEGTGKALLNADKWSSSKMISALNKEFSGFSLKFEEKQITVYRYGTEPDVYTTFGAKLSGSQQIDGIVVK